MTRFGWSVLTVACIAVSSVCQGQTGTPVIPSHEKLARLGLERMWVGQATLNISRDKVDHISLDEEMVFVQSDSGLITAFDAERGDRLWATKLGRGDSEAFPAIANENEVLVVTGAYLYSLNKRNGNTYWKLRLPGPPSTSPALDDEHVFLGMVDGSIYAVNLAKARELYQEQRLPQWSSETIDWRYQAFKEVTTQPVVASQIVNFASRGGSLYGVTARDHKLAFQLETEKAIVAPLARWEDRLFVASEDFSVYSLNANNGKVYWEFLTSAPIRKPPIALDRDLFLSPERRGLFCLDLQTGELRWVRPEVEFFAAATSDSVYATDMERNLMRIDRENGAIIGAIPMRSFPVTLPNIVTDRIYLATTSGLVLALRQTGRTFPVYHQNPLRLPIVPMFAPEEEEAEAVPTTDGEPTPAGSLDSAN